MAQGPRRPLVAQRPAVTPGGPQALSAQVRDMLEQARSLLARAERLLAQSSVPAERGPMRPGPARPMPPPRR